jgi:ABC-type phosphonate transport system ATPase subunit
LHHHPNHNHYHLDLTTRRYHAHLNRQEWLVVTQAFEDGLKVQAAAAAAAVLSSDDRLVRLCDNSRPSSTALA